jgi:hypothetical protein
VLRRLLTLFAVMILAYLVLVHFTGFSKDVAAVTNLTTSSTKVFQGR